VILDDIDLDTAAKTIARAECALNGQVARPLDTDRRDEGPPR
jgi:hypothetical protein